MNFYDVLGIKHDASKNDIKKAYQKLALLFHPDKCIDPNANEKFLEIKTAYEILSNDIRRKEYDGMTGEQKIKLYEVIKQYFTEIRPEHSHIYDYIINFIYSNEEEFEKDINSMNIKNIFNKIIDKIKKTCVEEYITKNYITITSNDHTICVTLKEKYEEGFKYVRIMDNEYILPLNNNQFIINDPKIGQVTIHINCLDDKDFKQINDFDLFITRCVSLSQYIYGGKIKFYHLDGENIWLNFSGCLEIKPIFIIKNKGLPKLLIDNDNKDDDTNGDLYVYVTIEGINSASDDPLNTSYSKVMEETINLLFPPIDSE